MTVTFCGHSQFTETPKDEEKILSILEEIIIDRDVEFYLGGYGSFDAFAKKCCSKYKENHPNARLIFVTPYMDDDYLKNRLDYSRNPYDGILYPSLEGKPPKFAVSYRSQ